MAELDERDRDIVRLAGMKKRLALFLFVGALVIAFYHFVIDDMMVFKPDAPLISDGDSLPDTQLAYEPIPFDSTEISGGIHVPTGMIADTGCAEVVRNCGACHSLELVKQNRATKDGWKNKIVWMQETQNLWDLGVQENVIIAYLAKNYGPQNSGRRPNLETPEWYQLD